jgi:thioesterase domain-containing protein/aryl carrier-like protein
VDSAGPRDAVELRVRDVWCQVLGLAQAGIHDDFFAVGGDSLLALKLIVALRRMGYELDYRTVMHAPTIASLAELLRRGDGSPYSSLVPLGSSGDGQPLFCFHPIGGGVVVYANLARELSRDRPVFGLQARGMDPALEPQRSIPEMAASYLAELRTVQPDGPYLLLGYSMGGVLAYEAACQLVAAGEEPSRVLMVDTHPADESGADLDFATEVLVRHALRLPLDVAELRRLDLDGRARRILGEATAAGVLPADYGVERLRRMLELYEVNGAALLDYEPPGFPGTVTLLRLEDNAGRGDMGWGRYAREVVAVDVPGNHYTALSSQQLPAIASTLRELLG